MTTPHAQAASTFSMTKPKTPAQRVGKHAAKRENAGQTQVYVRAWVLEGQEDAARAAMRKAAKKFAQPNPDQS